MRIALIHDWLTGMRGGEAVLSALSELFPSAELFTLIYAPKGRLSGPFLLHKMHTSLLQKVPHIGKRYRQFLPFMPWLIERFNLKPFDLVISSSHCVAKGVRKSPHAVHVSYVHAPMRYMWDRFDEYFSPGRANFLVRFAARAIRRRIQKWDRSVSSSDRVNVLVGNSRYIAELIHCHYSRDAKVVHPFVDLQRFSLPRRAGRNYLMVSAFAPYKRIDIAIEAFNRMGLPLIIIGSGQDEERLKKMAGPTVEILSGISAVAIAEFYSKCRAFIFPGIEDFGITPLEAMASGAPVVAYAKGGVLDSVTPETGLFFTEQTPESLIEAIQKIESGSAQFDEAKCRERAAEFTKEKFQERFAAIVVDAWVSAGKSRESLSGISKFFS